MAALLVGMSVMAVLLSVAMPTWNQMIRREKEEELVFRGNQYARAINLYQRKFANASPTSLDVLIEQHMLRKKFRDPMSTEKEGQFQMLYINMTAQPGRQGGAGQGSAGQAGSTGTTLSTTPSGGGIMGVTSKNTGESIRTFTDTGKQGSAPYGETTIRYALGPTSLLTGSARYGFEEPPDQNTQVVSLRTTLGYVKSFSPRLTGQVSEVDVSDSRLTRLVLMNGVRVVGPAWPNGARQLSGLRATLADLNAKGMMPREVDVRFKDQIVVRGARPTGATATTTGSRES